jgi:hypothetical protein
MLSCKRKRSDLKNVIHCWCVKYTRIENGIFVFQFLQITNAVIANCQLAEHGGLYEVIVKHPTQQRVQNLKIGNVKDILLH